MTDMDNMTDKDLDELLKATGQPQLPKGFADRLQAKLDADAPAKVIAFPQRKAAVAQPKTTWWVGALPLAASLVLGIFVGAVDAVPLQLESIETALQGESVEAEIGIEDTEEFLDGDLS
jgi:hypothetical protein